MIFYQKNSYKKFFIVFDKFIVFALVGVFGTLTQYAVLFICVSFFDIIASMASGIGYLCGAVVNYSVNHFLTFKEGSQNRSHSRSVPRFYFSVGVGFLINVGLMSVFVDHLGLNVWFIQFFATGVCLIWNYIAAKYWVFK